MRFSTTIFALAAAVVSGFRPVRPSGEVVRTMVDLYENGALGTRFAVAPATDPAAVPPAVDAVAVAPVAEALLEPVVTGAAPLPRSLTLFQRLVAYVAPYLPQTAVDYMGAGAGAGSSAAFTTSTPAFVTTI